MIFVFVVGRFEKFLIFIYFSSNTVASQENAKLLDLVDKVGEHSWSRIAQDIPGRTDNQCWRRWKMIIKEREAREREVDPAASTNGGGKKKKKKRSEEEEEEERSAVGNKRRKGSEASVGGQPRKKNKIQGDILVQRGAKEQETEAETQETETEIEQGKGKGKGKGRGKGKGKGKENEKERKGKETSMEADEGSEGEAEVVEEDVGGKEKKKKMWTKKPFTVTMPGLIQVFVFFKLLYLLTHKLAIRVSCDASIHIEFNLPCTVLPPRSREEQK